METLNVPAFMTASIRCDPSACGAGSLEEYGRTDRCLKIVLQLIHTDVVGLEYQVLHVDMQRQPIRRQHAKAGTEIHGEVVITGERDVADAADHVQGAGHGKIATDEYLAREEVVAQRQVVVREAPLSIGK